MLLFVVEEGLATFCSVSSEEKSAAPNKNTRKAPKRIGFTDLGIFVVLTRVTINIIGQKKIQRRIVTQSFRFFFGDIGD